MDPDTSIQFGDGEGGRGEETKDLGGKGRSEEKRCYAGSSKQSNQLEICL
jgi:hypothetical protein